MVDSLYYGVYTDESRVKGEPLKLKSENNTNSSSTT